ncbi:dihydrolipoyl dehydrogenase [Paracoccus sp. PAMC 22219]|uniref:dihydrolipoyl dehydrogenase n=1 Tax=Paracoccus sp. PAMC 22219 TaxID=1569209 RepID=UPI0005A5F4E8|nr:dihydrolipoyl dehydrogenase [Paracoccus sp. PAMC 22219]
MSPTTDRREPAESDLTCDVAVIGAGTAGIAAERAARKAGARTLLIDPEFRGTLCANTGCMPSKLLIAASHAAHAARRAPVFGVHPGDPVIDGPAVMTRVRAERDRFVEFTRESFDDLPEGTAVRARARFVRPTELALDDGRRVRARAVVIATGSFALVPEPFRDLGPRILTNETVFELPDLPDSLAVIGGGPIGLELAQAMGRLGVPVTLFDQGTRLGKARCDVVHDTLQTAIARDVTLCLGVETTPTADADGIRLAWTGDMQGEQVFSHVLVAVGRPPNLKGLGLDASGLDLDDHGTPKFDRTTMQCGSAPVFMAGDANADATLLHEASTEGAIAGTNAATFPDVTPGERSPTFALTFTDPPLASVGTGPGDGVICGRSDYSDQGRARAEARAEGVVTLYADAQGRLSGADLCCPGADHLGHLLAWSVQSGATATGLLSMPFYHPTLEEGLKTALRQICRDTRQPEPAGRDFGTPPGA